MSLRWRILGAFLFIITLSITFSIGVGYYATQQQLDVFVAQLARVEADNLARNLSHEYTSADGWESVDVALSGSGYLYDEETGEHEGGSEHSGESESEGEEGGAEAFHIDQIRIVVVDGNGIVIRDNFSELSPGTDAPSLGGERATVVDQMTGQPVGYAYVDVNREFLATESHGLLRGILTATAVGGLLTAFVAFLLAAWLSRRITAPVTALTEATQAVAEQGETALLPVTSSDELGQMSAAFNRMTTTLQTQRELRKRLVNDLAHELNTPLSVVRLEATGLRDGLQTPTRAADQIIQEVNMLHNLVRDLNWLAETDSGELRLNVEPTSLDQLLVTEVERWQPQAQAHHVDLTLQPLPVLPTLDLDPLRMSQALGNILHNALQHTEPDGSITVAAAANPTGSVTITISDDGAGIDAADLPHIFDRLYRADAARNRSTGGTGIGLAIARAIIEAHRGEITIVSAGLGQGTTVNIMLRGVTR